MIIQYSRNRKLREVIENLRKIADYENDYENESVYKNDFQTDL